MTQPKLGLQEIKAFEISDDASEFYANALHIGMTPWDISLMFGSNTFVGSQGDEPPQVRIDAIIRMSPQHAKATYRALEKALAIYEESFGTVPTIEIPQEKNDAPQ